MTGGVSTRFSIPLLHAAALYAVSFGLHAMALFNRRPSPEATSAFTACRHGIGIAPALSHDGRCGGGSG